jgi:hypothetical protein
MGAETPGASASDVPRPSAVPRAKPKLYEYFPFPNLHHTGTEGGSRDVRHGTDCNQ